MVRSNACLFFVSTSRTDLHMCVWWLHKSHKALGSIWYCREWFFRCSSNVCLYFCYFLLEKWFGTTLTSLSLCFNELLLPTLQLLWRFMIWICSHPPILITTEGKDIFIAFHSDRVFHHVRWKPFHRCQADLLTETITSEFQAQEEPILCILWKRVSPSFRHLRPNDLGGESSSSGLRVVADF